MRPRLPILAGATLLALFAAACHKPEEPAASETNVTEPAKPAPPPAPKIEKPVEAPKPEAAKAPPPPEVPPDQQVLDDADATGMTSRIDRSSDGDAGAAANGNAGQ